MADRVHTDVEASALPDLDAQLMLQVREGDDDSFRALLDKYRNPLIYFIYRMVRDQAVAEELAQEVFLRIYRSRASYEATAKFTTWMFRIATHVSLNWLRDERNALKQERLDHIRGDFNPVRQVVDGKPTVEQDLLRHARANEVRDAVAALPHKQRAAVLMHKYHEMGYAQIAGALDCSESAVKSMLFRAYETLRARLAHMDAGGLR